MVLAAGMAPLEDVNGRPIAVANARKVAEVNAHRELAKAIYGATRSGNEQLIAETTDRGGAERIREQFRSFSREEIEATLRRAEVAGSWYREGKRFIVVLVAVGNAGNPLFAAKTAATGTALKFRNVHLAPKWREAFCSRPGILLGGAALYRDGGETCVLVVGRANLKDPRTAENKDLVAHATAEHELVKFVTGLKLKASKETQAEQVRITEDKKTVFEDCKETFRDDYRKRTRLGPDVAIRRRLGSFRRPVLLRRLRGQRGGSRTCAASGLHAWPSMPAPWSPAGRRSGPAGRVRRGDEFDDVGPDPVAWRGGHGANHSITCGQARPLGCGVPVLGTIDGSSPSTSIDR